MPTVPKANTLLTSCSHIIWLGQPCVNRLSVPPIKPLSMTFDWHNWDHCACIYSHLKPPLYHDLGFNTLTEQSSNGSETKWVRGKRVREGSEEEREREKREQGERSRGKEQVREERERERGGREQTHTDKGCVQKEEMASETLVH